MRLADAKQNLEHAYPSTNVHTFVAEVDDTTKTTSLFEEIRANIAEPDVLVLNAGSGHPPSPALAISEDSLVKDFDVNVRGNLSYVAEYLKPETLIKEKVILNVSTFATHFPVLNFASYGASKLAMIHFLMHVQAEHDDQNVRILNLHPGVVYTSMVQGSGVGKDSISWDDGT